MLLFDLSVVERNGSGIREGEPNGPIEICATVAICFAGDYSHADLLFVVLLVPVEWHLLAGFDEKRRSFRRFLSEEHCRLSVIDNDV